MALLDPCLSFEPHQNQTNSNHDEREAISNDEEAEPLTPTSVTKSLTAPSTPLLSSLNSNSHSNHLTNSTTTNPLPAQLSTLPTVLQSVFSYIFTDANGNQQRTSILNVNTSGSSSQTVVSLPSTPTSSTSRMVPPLPLLESRSLSAPPSHIAFLHNSSTPSFSYQKFEQEIDLQHIPEGESDPSSECLTPVREGEDDGIEGEIQDSSSTQHSATQHRKRACAVLDLDETLLHSFFPDKITGFQYQTMIAKCRDQEEEEANGLISPDERTLYTVDVGDGTIVVLMLRPFLRKFLHDLFERYDVGVWSAGGKLYVDAICRVLFPSDGKLKPLFQLCWDDVQIDSNTSYAYTKPLTTISARFHHYDITQLFLIDNRKDNGYYFPSQLVLAPDYLPRPWEFADSAENDSWLNEKAIAYCEQIVHQMEHLGKSRALRMEYSNSEDVDGEGVTTFYMEDIDMSVTNDIISDYEDPNTD